jgi:hypothetical protein
VTPDAESGADFTAVMTHTAIAKVLAGAMIGLEPPALLLLLWLSRHV